MTERVLKRVRIEFEYEGEEPFVLQMVKCQASSFTASLTQLRGFENVEGSFIPNGLYTCDLHVENKPLDTEETRTVLVAPPKPDEFITLKYSHTVLPQSHRLVADEVAAKLVPITEKD